MCYFPVSKPVFLSLSEAREGGEDNLLRSSRHVSNWVRLCLVFFRDLLSVFGEYVCTKHLLGSGF
jgi:hypothetical protein